MKTRKQQLSPFKKEKVLKRHSLAAFILFLALLFPSLIHAQGLVNVSGNPGVINTSVGSDFTITIQLNAIGASVTVADIYMTFNPNVIHVTSTSFAPESPFTSSTFPAPAPDNVLGKWSRGGFGFTPATDLFDYITVNCTAVGSGTTVMNYVTNGTFSTLLAFAGQNVTGTLVPIQINVASVTIDCPDLGVNNGDECAINGHLGEYVNCECVAYDCNWVAGGFASIDDCGVCSGGNTGLIPNASCTDCEGVVNGDAHPGSVCHNGEDIGTFNENCECISNPKGSIQGVVTGITSCGPRNVTISIYNSEYPELDRVFYTEINENGEFSTPVFSTEAYSILIKIDGYLAKLYPDKIIESGNNAIAVSELIAGDVNNSNDITIVDVSFFGTAFGSAEGAVNYRTLADLNCDGYVNILDVSILSPSFGMSGDQYFPE